MNSQAQLLSLIPSLTGPYQLSLSALLSSRFQRVRLPSTPFPSGVDRCIVRLVVGHANMLGCMHPAQSGTERHRAAIDGAAGAVGALDGSGGSEAKKIQSTRGRGRSCYSSRPTSAICRVMHMSPSITRETLPLKYCSSLYL